MANEPELRADLAQALEALNAPLDVEALYPKLAATIREIVKRGGERGRLVDSVRNGAAREARISGPLTDGAVKLRKALEAYIDQQIALREENTK